MKSSKRICKKGHVYFKSSSCPTCPICEKEKKSKEGLFSVLSAPARRALESQKIKTLKQLAEFSEAELLQLHGIGPASMPTLKSELKKAGLNFKKEK
jgi:DNA-directed RNA polymerase alpha subunit